MSVLTSVVNRVGIITLNRLSVMNALNTELYANLVSKLQEFDANDSIGAVVLTGGDKVFSVGADIKQVCKMTSSDLVKNDIMSYCKEFDKIRVPIIGVVKGLALGGGFELGLACDILYAGTSAKFGLPEVKLGVIPGNGGTQRLTKLIGKSRANEMILSGKIIDATTAEKWSIVSSVYPDDIVMDKALELAQTIASYSKSVVGIAKNTILLSYETRLQDGLDMEKDRFISLFDTEDQKEGMNAYLEKRVPEWKHK